MLDVPLRHNNSTLGVLCAEHVGGTRPWTVDEQNFMISVGNLVVAAIADDERRGRVDGVVGTRAPFSCERDGAGGRIEPDEA